MKQPAVYIMASSRRGTIYIGATSNLVGRAAQHRLELAEGFTQRHGIKTLVWYELHDEMSEAIARERALKEWQRAWKLRLIEEFNPTWRDLFLDLL